MSNEIIVVLQPSPKNKAEIIDSLYGNMNIRIIVNQERDSIGHNRNLGAISASGEFLCFIDDDIMVDWSFLSRIRTMVIEPFNLYFPEIRNMESVPFPLGDHVGGKSFVTACFLLSKKAFEECGPFNEELSIYREDSEFFIRATKKGMKLEFAEGLYVYHPVRFTTKSTLKSFFRKNTYEPLFHRLTGGDYAGVLSSGIRSTLPGRRGFSSVFFFILGGFLLATFLVITKQFYLLLGMVVLYSAVSLVPSAIYMRNPSIFLGRGPLYKIPMISIYLILFPLIFISRILGSIKYRHFAV